MKSNAAKNVIFVFLAVMIAMTSLFGCASNQKSNSDSNKNSFNLKPIFDAVLFGSLFGGIIGYQSGEALAGAIIGGSITGTGSYLDQADKANRKEPDKSDNPCHPRKQADEKVTVNVQNFNGSYTPVRLKKHGTEYIGPKGEHYPSLPSEEQLRPVYGLPELPAPAKPQNP